MNAVLAVLAGTARLSRRDRAALTLALSWVTSRPFSAFGALELGDAVSRELADIYNVLNGRDVDLRLALLLRLVLRCDRGDPPPAWRVVWPGGRGRETGRVESTRATYQDAHWLTRAWADYDARIERIVPLWCQAPAMRAR